MSTPLLPFRANFVLRRAGILNLIFVGLELIAMEVQGMRIDADIPDLETDSESVSSSSQSRTAREVEIGASWEAQEVGNRSILGIVAMASQQVGNRSVRAAIDKTHRLVSADYEKIVEWLEIPENFSQLTGQGRRTRIGGKYSSKKTTFRQMLVMLHDHGFPREVTTGENLGKRYDRYVKKYREALALKNQSGGGLTEDDVDQGMTIEEKLDKLCPHFDRMHAIYGERANVAPPMLGVLGFAEHDEVYRDAADADNEPIILGEQVNESSEDRTEIIQPQEEGNLGYENWFEDEAIVHEEDVTQATVDCGQSFDDDDQTPQPEHPRPEEEAPAPILDWSQPASQQRMQPRQTSEGAAQRVRPAAPQPSSQPGMHQPAAQQPSSQPGTAAASQTRGQLRPPRRAHAPPLPSQAPAKPNLAQVYAENLASKQEFRATYMEKKESWKRIELEDRREAQGMDAHQLEKKAKVDNDLKLKMFRAERRSTLLMELSKSNRSVQEMKDAWAFVECDDLDLQSP